MTKKLISICILLLLVICISVSVFAADNTVVVNVNSQSAEIGETVTFTATLASEKEIFSGSVQVVYDKNVLQLESGKWLIHDTQMSPFDKTTGMGAFKFAPDTTGNISGSIFSATFKVLDTAAAGTTEVKLLIDLKYAVDSDAKYTVTNNPGSMTVIDNTVTEPTVTTAPETTVPETTVPTTTAPTTTVPETTAPETTTLETISPETTSPETTSPETTSPETTSPETTSPETSERPDVTEAETIAPDQTETPSETNVPADNDDPENPKTGSPVLLVILICIVSAISVTVIVTVMKKRACR